ncbi:PucR family transcriptional regulator [Thermoactinospora rubra]|uniref:PucR family transcriptional regulator n=1 Tax=Thermoactinospora rubra TaxID=1088767 RepID=UPI00117F5691|nr:PucR family transcriptional regulator [Thermoactinospora rubra]
MAPTLETVVRRLRLPVLAGGLAVPVRWVAVSELEDPTPFLEGGELLLTTGMRLAPPYEPYIRRLIERGVAGLGFGVGLGHDTTPPELVEAARAAGLPLVEVPRETPFIAIGKVVSEALAAEQYEELSRAFAAQGRLTRAALEGVEAVVGRLAGEVGGWAALLEEGGAVRHATPGADVEPVVEELARLRRAAPVAGRAPSSLALSSPGAHIVVQPLGSGRRIRALLAVGARHPFSPVTHTVINTAASILTLALERGRVQAAAERRVRAAVLRLLLAGQTGEAREALARLGERLPDEPVVTLVTAGEVRAGGFVADGAEGELIVLAHVQEAERVAAELPGAAGMGGPVPLDRLAEGVEQARQAFAAARRGGTLVRFTELAGQGLLSLLDPAAARAFAAALLAPLLEYGSRADLVGSLAAYLASNGHWDAAAQRLGIHRHTLRYRMRRVAELLGRDLDDPGVRAELWVALACLR